MAPGATEFEKVVLREVHRIGRALDTFTERVEQRLDKLAAEIKSDTDRLEQRVRALELEAAKSGVKLMFIGAIAGLIGTGIVEGAILLFHH